MPSEVGSHSKGRWSLEEDKKLQECKAKHGERSWDFVAVNSGLKRTPKSYRDRWLNYLAPEVIRGKIMGEEHEKLFQLNSKWGNNYSMIASELPGRTYEQVRSYDRMMDRRKRKQNPADSIEEPTRELIRQDCARELTLEDTEMQRKKLETKFTNSYALESTDVSFSRNNADIDSKLESVGELIPKVMEMARELLKTY
ncbi:myb-related protein 340-like [Tripterygium wilfordii]|uniref:myb-related protein 340-like n=1 Tax=Tripterygium wilfordii TaxID=458696 RepID=UPI0018F8039A|nr:myb-related protein 340-like [Tripterygium wilfordii]